MPLQRDEEMFDWFSFHLERQLCFFSSTRYPEGHVVSRRLLVEQDAEHQSK